MPEIKESDLKQQIKSGDFSRMYFIYGEEDYLKKLYVDKIVAKTVSPEFEAFNLHILEGADVNVDKINECVEAMPLMSEYVCVLVKDFPIASLDSKELSKFNEMISNLPDTTVLIFWFYSVEVKGKAWTPVLKEIKKYGSVANLKKMTENDVAKILMSAAKKKSCTLEKPAALKLVETAGNDLNLLLNELEKLCFFVDGGEITPAIVEDMVAKSVEVSAFDMVNGIIGNDPDKAFSILDSLFVQKVEPVVIMGSIIFNYVDMYRVKVALANGKSSADVVSQFGYSSEYRVNKAVRIARNLSLEQIRQCLIELMKSDGLLKGSAVNKRLVIEETIIKLMKTVNSSEKR